MVVEPCFFGAMDFRYSGIKETLNKVRISYVLKN